VYGTVLGPGKLARPEPEPSLGAGSATLEKAAGSTGFLNSFSTSRAFTNLRNASRLYFSDDKNYLFPDLAFEVELANLPVSPQNGRRDLDLDDVDGETVLDFLLRRAFDPSKDSWWEEYPNWREPEAATCRQDVPKEVPASTPAPSAPSAPSKAAKVKSWINKTVNDALNCVEGNDADNKVSSCDKCSFYLARVMPTAACGARAHERIFFYEYPWRGVPWPRAGRGQGIPRRRGF